MNMFNSYTSERLQLMNISHNKNAWPRNAYKNDAFYQYALSNHCLPIGMMHEHYFAYTCYHKMTGEFVGYIQGYLPANKKTIWIQTFLIDKKYLRQGFGTEFYEGVLKGLNSQISYSKVFLVCYEANSHGRVFWENLRFRKVLETAKLALIQHQPIKLFIYEKEIVQGLQKEFIYEQENIKNFGIQQNC